MEFEIMFDDLTEECQQRLIEQIGQETLDDMNTDVMPIATVVVED
jgi:hypothetical protein